MRNGITKSAVELRTLRFCCVSGLFGSALFLAGDMLFYGSLSSGEAFHPYLEMAKRPVEQLVLGGALGPVAALLSAMGMGLFYFVLKTGSQRLAAVAALSMAVMMLVGGSYHAVYTVLGLASRIVDAAPREALLAEVKSLRDTISLPMYAAGIAGTLLVYLVALWKKTQFPRWLLMVLPTTLSMLEQVFRKYFLALPAPVGAIIRGGWINGSFFLFFAIATCVFWETDEPRCMK